MFSISLLSGATPRREGCAPLGSPGVMWEGVGTHWAPPSLPICGVPGELGLGAVVAAGCLGRCEGQEVGTEHQDAQRCPELGSDGP